jgi:hypothetical protein
MARAAWLLAAAAALAFLVVLALHGRRPDGGLQAFQPRGVMTGLAPDQAREVEITNGGRTWHFRRQGQTWQSLEANRPVAAEAAQAIDAGLRLLRDSAPLRVMSAAEVGSNLPAEYGLGADAMRVAVTGPAGESFVVRFGALNPLGVAHYARIDGMAEVHLLASYLAEGWHKVIESTTP